MKIIPNGQYLRQAKVNPLAPNRVNVDAIAEQLRKAMEDEQ